jgi:hypothetical protein
MSKRRYYKLKILSTTNLRVITALLRAITVLLPVIAGLPSDDGPLLPDGFERPHRRRLRKAGAPSSDGFLSVGLISASC